MLVFDIETGPLPDEELRKRVDPFEAPQHPGQFDESSVKLGNLKDAEKIRQKIDEAKQKHAESVAKYEADVTAARSAWWGNAVSRAPLSPLTGRIVAIGYLNTGSGAVALDIQDDEQAMIQRWFTQYKKCRDLNRKMAGHNINSFDVPFIVRRAWLLGCDVPQTILDRGRYLDSTFVDTMQLWGVGNREPVKLDVVAQAFGVGGKPDGVNGAMFAGLLKTDRPTAEKYLENDLQMTAAVAQRMGVI